MDRTIQPEIQTLKKFSYTSSRSNDVAKRYSVDYY